MIYLTDFLFIVSYVAIKEKTGRFMDCKLRMFLGLRKWIYRFEIVFVLGYMYVRPMPSDMSEKGVSFFICLTTYIILDNLITKKDT